MDQFKPHRNPSFEGYYTRFHLPDGASLLVILCTVPQATDGRSVNLNITYVPANNGRIWQAELW